MAVTDQIKILNKKIKQNEAQYDSERKAAKISALSSNNLGKYEYLTDEDLDLKPSTAEQVKFEYSPLGKIFNKGLDEEDKKEGLLKRLKNTEKDLKSNNNNNNKSNLSSLRSESSVYSTPSSARSESSKKTSISDDELEKIVYFPDVANISDIDTLEPKNKTKTSFYYLKDMINKLFKDYSKIFDSDLKNFFKDIAFEEEKNINYNLLSKEIYLSSGNVFSFFGKYGDLYEFCFALFEEKNIYAGDIKLEQIKFLKDLMNGYKVCKRFERFKRVKGASIKYVRR